MTGNDVDSGPALSYALVLDGDAAGTFGVLRYGGHIALTGPLDHEQRSRYALTVRASDSRHEAEANLTVIVEDINDNAPVFSQGLYQVLPCRPHTCANAHACWALASTTGSTHAHTFTSGSLQVSRTDTHAQSLGLHALEAHARPQRVLQASCIH